MGLPLDGVRVLDLSHDWAGPHATRLLADLGAEVIKVEYPRRLDGMRGGHLTDGRFDKHPRFWQLHRGKMSLTLDLERQGHLERARALVRWADIVVDASRPGVLDRLGLGWDVLVAERSDIILIQLSAFGATGPDSAHGGYGGGIEPHSGVQAFTAYAPELPPRRIREMDVINGLAGACAVLTALVRRQVTGEAQRVDMSQTEVAITSLAGAELLETAVLGVAPVPTGNRHRSAAPQGCYPCRGEDRWVVLTVRSTDEWHALCRVLGRPDLLSDRTLESAGGRMAAHDRIDDVIANWTRQRDHRAAMAELQEAGVAAGAVLDPSDLAADTHLGERGWFVDAEDGSGRYPGMPFRFVGEAPRIRRRGPFLGEHNAHVTTEILGLPESEAEAVDPDELGTAFDPE
jgi:crotonobetainyl-CoA:carnitine CoA-transferase CaiB-like acyl-CoA transferase